MSYKRRVHRLRPLVFALGLAGSPGAWADATTDQAKTLIDSGRSQQAYDLLIPLESQRAGEEVYDLLLGIAAADIGRSTNAVMALERVLAVNPKNVRARAEIARAYFALSEVKTARQEFARAKQEGVPTDVAATIDRFLSAVERVEEASKPTARFYVEASMGWDGNVNAGPTSSQIAVPGFGGAVFDLTGSSAKQADGYSGLAAGVAGRLPLDPRTAITGGLTTSKRMNDTWDAFDTGSWDANLGITRTEEKNIYSLSVLAGTFFVDNLRYRESYGLSAQWQHNYSQRTQATFFMQYADQQYPRDSLKYDGRRRDVERWTLGAGAAHALRDAKTIFFGSVYVGTEEARVQQTHQLDQRFVGVRGGAQHQYSKDFTVFANASFENREYLGKDPLFDESRNDDTWQMAVGATYEFAKDWKVTPQIQYIDNHSNLSVNKYTRDVVSLTVRHEF